MSARVLIHSCTPLLCSIRLSFIVYSICKECNVTWFLIYLCSCWIFAMTSEDHENYTEACRTLFLPHSAPSWILSKPENLASSSLQDGATGWYYYCQEPVIWQAGHPTTSMFEVVYISFYWSDSCQTSNIELCYPIVRCPHLSLNICPKLECVVSPPIKHLISSVVSLAQLVSSSVALPAKLVFSMLL